MLSREEANLACSKFIWNHGFRGKVLVDVLYVIVRKMIGGISSLDAQRSIGGGSLCRLLLVIMGNLLNVFGMYDVVIEGY